MFEEEKVDRNAVKEFAESIDATLRYTSAKNSEGIEDLFRLLGTRYLDPTYKESDKSEPSTRDTRTGTVNLAKNKGAGKKEGCC